MLVSVKLGMLLKVDVREKKFRKKKEIITLVPSSTIVGVRFVAETVWMSSSNCLLVTMMSWYGCGYGVGLGVNSCRCTR